MNIIIGTTESGEEISLNFNVDPHLLLTGYSGSGKTNLLHLLIQLLSEKYTVDEVGLILVEPKRIDFSEYKTSPYAMAGVIYSNDQALSLLQWMDHEMERRRGILDEDGVLNIEDFNIKKGATERLRRVFYIVDECSDLLRDDSCRVEFEDIFVRLMLSGGPLGLHIILATSCPAWDIFTDRLRVCAPCKIALPMAAAMDLSDLFRSEKGQEMLSGPGHALMECKSRVYRVVKFQVPLSYITCRDDMKYKKRNCSNPVGHRH